VFGLLVHLTLSRSRSRSWSRS